MEPTTQLAISPVLIPSLLQYALATIFPPLAIWSIMSGPSAHLVLSMTLLFFPPYGFTFAQIHAIVLIYRYYGNSFVVYTISYSARAEVAVECEAAWHEAHATQRNVAEGLVDQAGNYTN